ncbi:hypothetical protein TNCV_4350871 [Trichonephila clavipes]|nr:hypothetical protein TNCV_4350871 [Trichonephila clavipes]
MHAARREERLSTPDIRAPLQSLVLGPKPALIKNRKTIAQHRFWALTPLYRGCGGVRYATVASPNHPAPSGSQGYRE